MGSSFHDAGTDICRLQFEFEYVGKLLESCEDGADVCRL